MERSHPARRLRAEAARKGIPSGGLLRAVSRAVVGTVVGTGLVAGVLLPVVGCGEKADDRAQEEPTPAVESSLLEPRPPRTLSWPEQPEARAYEVHAWAGDRLLFVERTLRPQLTTTYALERAMAPFDSVVLRVRVQARDGSRAGEIIEVPVE